MAMPIRDPRSWMWAEACDRVTQADRLHRQFFRLGTGSAAATRWEPPVDVVEDMDSIVIYVALPGVAPERVAVSFDAGQLVIGAYRPSLLNSRRSQSTVHRLEIPYGHFERRVALPPGRYELLEQAFSHGCLELRLVKR
jgi:HSP20 family molecular chaperone IbpA